MLLNKDIFELSVERTSLARGADDNTEMTQVHTGAESQKLNTVMDRLVHLRKERAKCIKKIESAGFEDKTSSTSRFETPKAKTKDSKALELRRESDKLGKQILKMQSQQQRLQKKLRKAESEFKAISMQIKVKQKQKEDLLVFKKKTIKSKEACNVNDKLVDKYRAKQSTQLISKIKELSRNKSHYTEKDRVIYNQLHDIENKQVTFADQVDVIKHNKRAVTRHLTTCDEKIRVLSREYFENFRASLESHFAQFEPNFNLDTALVEVTQSSTA